MAEAVGYTDLRREDDGRTTAVKVVDGVPTERVDVRVSVEREHRRGDGTLVSSGEVASSDRPAGAVGSIEVGS